MMKTDAFIRLLIHSRKRTGIVLFNPDRMDFLSDFKDAGAEIIDLSQDFPGQVILSDNAFLKLVTEKALGKIAGFVNAELYLAPRFEENQYFKYLMPKLLNSEPLKPFFFIFYSKPLYEKFKTYYLNYSHTCDHIFEEDL